MTDGIIFAIYLYIRNAKNYIVKSDEAMFLPLFIEIAGESIF